MGSKKRGENTMSRQVVEAGVPHDIYLAAKAAGINFSQTLTDALIKKLSIEAKETRQKLNLAQNNQYEEAMSIIVPVLISESNGHKLRTSSLEFANEHSKKLNMMGYFTNPAELLKEAELRIIKQR